MIFLLNIIIFLGKKDHVTQIISNQEVQSSVKNFQLIMENKDRKSLKC